MEIKKIHVKLKYISKKRTHIKPCLLYLSTHHNPTQKRTIQQQRKKNFESKLLNQKASLVSQFANYFNFLIYNLLGVQRNFLADSATYICSYVFSSLITIIYLFIIKTWEDLESKQTFVHNTYTFQHLSMM